MTHLRILIFPILESVFEAIERTAGHLRERVAICTTCGGNRYTDEPCVFTKEALDLNKVLDVVERDFR